MGKRDGLLAAAAVWLLLAVPSEQFSGSHINFRGTWQGREGNVDAMCAPSMLRGRGEVGFRRPKQPQLRLPNGGQERAATTLLHASEGTEMEVKVASGIEDLIESGTVRVWRRCSAPPEALSGGARGAGHNKTSSRQHREPEEIYVIGTSHVSEQSARDVERVVRAIQPDNVVVELCRSRAGLMYTDDSKKEDQPSMLSLNGASFASAFSRSLTLGGGTAFLLRALLARSTALSEVVGVVGKDFRAARISGEECGAQIVLGDRPVEITLERSWRALSLEEKSTGIKLLVDALVGRGNSTELMEQKRDMERATGAQAKQVVDNYETQLAEIFPSVIEPLIKERDIFLSLTMKGSMAVNGCKTVVGVVGAGHLDGVMRCLDEDHSGKFKNLTWTPSRAALKDKVFGVPRAVWTRLANDTIFFGGLYILYLLYDNYVAGQS